MTRTFLFTADTEPHFKRLLGSYHEQFNTKLLACGVDNIGVNIETVKMSTMFNDSKYLSRVVGGMKKFQPDINVLLLDDDTDILFQCIIYELRSYFPNDTIPLLDGMYMIQNACKYPSPDKCLYQIWELQQDTSIKDINTLWTRDEKR